MARRQQKQRTMGSRIILRVMPLCAALLVTVVSSGAMAQTKQEVDLLIGGEFVWSRPAGCGRSSPRPPLTLPVWASRGWEDFFRDIKAVNAERVQCGLPSLDPRL